MDSISVDTLIPGGKTQIHYICWSRFTWINTLDFIIYVFSKMGTLKAEEVESMFGKNLSFFRNKQNLSVQRLAEQTGVTSMEIVEYEKGISRPDTLTLRRLASALGIRVMDFLRETGDQLSFQHEPFRSSERISRNSQALIRAQTEETLGRLYEAMDLLGEVPFRSVPPVHILPFTANAEENGQKLRRYFQLGKTGSVGHLIPLLENHGFLAVGLDCEEEDFSGTHGFVEGRPFIVFNENLSDAQIRFTLTCELAHLLFVWPENIDASLREEWAASIAGAFLFPAGDAESEFGGSQTDQLKKESDRISPERPSLLENFVYRAASEGIISRGKGAELLKMSAYEFMVRTQTAAEQRIV